MKIEDRVSQLVRVIPKKTLQEVIEGEYQISDGRVKVLKRLLAKDGLQNEEFTSAEIKTLNRLEKQFVNEIIVSSIEKNTSSLIDTRSIKAHKRYILIKNLFNLGQGELSIFYAKKLLREAKQLYLDDLSLLLADFIEYYYSFISFDFKKSKDYSDFYNDQLKMIQLKKNVSRLYYELVNRVVKNKGFMNIDEQNRFRKILENDLPPISPTSNIMITQRVFSCRYFYHLLISDYTKLYSIADETLEFYRENFSKFQLQNFMALLWRAVASIYLKDYSSARKDFKDIAKFNATPGSLHWNSWQSNAFTLEMLTRNYQDAAFILTNVSVQAGLSKLDDIWLQQWRIRSAYIHFLVKINMIDLSLLGKKRIPNFRLGKFLNEVPHYSKDKRGLNISIIIAQFIILLADRKYGHLIDKTEALSKYSYRHLKNDQNLRSNCFIRMLLSLVKADFNPIRASRYAEKYVKRLNFTEMNLNEYSAEIEIIPYEELWEIILDITKPLQRKRA